MLEFVLLWQGDDRCPSLAELKEFSQPLNSVCRNLHLLFLQCFDYPLALCLEGVSNNEIVFIQWNLDFSNPPDNSNEKSFPLLS